MRRLLHRLLIVTIVLAVIVGLVLLVRVGYADPDPTVAIPSGGRVVYFSTHSRAGYAVRIVDLGKSCVTEYWSYNGWDFVSTGACLVGP